ncbi:MAG TPA: hypothetical protein VFA06_11340 [Actinocrinis sp.]|uniref:hypothetical protein n=1 Tax=Actinocrinis sp. TaxID=1920516 RepID=UPI002D6FC8C9|nr:hypothetical protein [Actinocrinis sp.]HZU56453.1 hypothetical protein [Actinocrinis sp.]
MPDYDEHDPYGETRAAPGEPATSGEPDAAGSVDPFDAFRARRAQERAEQAPFPEALASEPARTIGPSAETYDGAYAPPEPPPPYHEYTQVVPPVPFDEAASRAPRRRLRSAIVFGGVAALVIGVGAGVWAVTGSSGGAPAAAAGTPSASASASPGPKAGKAGKAVNARLTVTSVGSDSFTATTTRGETVVVHITSETRFGTAARPFTRAQLVPGAKVVARLRKDADGTVVATVIASEIATPNDQPSGTASPAAGA